MSEQQFIDAGYDAEYYSNIKYIAFDEEQHVKLLTSALTEAGVTPVDACEYSFPFTNVCSAGQSFNLTYPNNHRSIALSPCPPSWKALAAAHTQVQPTSSHLRNTSPSPPPSSVSLPHQFLSNMFTNKTLQPSKHSTPPCNDQLKASSLQQIHT